MDVNALYLARYAEQTGDGTMSIIGAGLSLVKVDALPFIFPSLAIVAKILLDHEETREEHVIKVLFLDPAGGVAFETEDFKTPVQKFVPDGEYLNVNLALTMNSVPVFTTGRYWVELRLDGEIIKKTPMLIRLKSVEVRPEPEGGGGS